MQHISDRWKAALLVRPLSFLLTHVPLRFRFVTILSSRFHSHALRVFPHTYCPFAQSLDRMSEVKPTHIDGFVTSGKSHIRDNFFGKMPRSVGGEHTADRVVVAPLSSFPMPGQGEDKDRPYSSPRIPTRLPPPPASASGSPATAGASPRTKRISQDEGGATKGSGGAGGSVEVGSGLFETPTMEPFPKRKTPRKNPNGHYQELESKLETTTLEPSQWE
mmetsp:Transcript_8321/g.22125  ORF Transcript_8321/g.22125 Transcript_8321/m.22125 type:complete len:219 (+) Transcript_8321:2292-2948(+)